MSAFVVIVASLLSQVVLSLRAEFHSNTTMPLDCAECKFKTTDLEARWQKAICEHTAMCSDEQFNHCIFQAAGCTRPRKQTCDACTKSYSERGVEVAKSACENPELCNSAIGEFGCNWDGAEKRCVRLLAKPQRLST
eukprot:Skav220808  [mRNA]  locus=scaffold150:470593:471003:+ [translate_table: standard]